MAPAAPLDGVPVENPADWSIELHGISKRFGDVQANRDVTLRVQRGTVHGIIGENGAGKSTLMSILYGLYQPDSGEILVHGQRHTLTNSAMALRLGIGMVHQHFMLVDKLSVVENVVLGMSGGILLGSMLKAARVELRNISERYQLYVDPDATVSDLSVGQQQRVEILKALFRGAEVLVLDEPTAVLTPSEADQLFRMVDTLRGQGKTILLVTHKLREIMHITDDVSVMRAGSIVASLKTSETNPGDLAELMVGRRIRSEVRKAPASAGRTLLAVEQLSVVDSLGVSRVKAVDLSVRAGEVVGIAGVAGNGQSELLEAICGMRAFSDGRIRIGALEMTPVSHHDASVARAAGLAHVPEDRHRYAMAGELRQWENAILGYHDDPALKWGPLLRTGACRDRARAHIDKFDVRPADCSIRSAAFSGGNQQKAVIARELAADPDILVIGQPTRGVDIGAIEFIHNQIVALRDRGKAILLVSVELDEIRKLSDRILVMFDGEIIGEADPASAAEAELGLLMAGVRSGEARPGHA